MTALVPRFYWFRWYVGLFCFWGSIGKRKRGGVLACLFAGFKKGGLQRVRGAQIRVFIGPVDQGGLLSDKT